MSHSIKKLWNIAYIKNQYIYTYDHTVRVMFEILDCEHEDKEFLFHAIFACITEETYVLLLKKNMSISEWNAYCDDLLDKNADKHYFPEALRYVCEFKKAVADWSLYRMFFVFTLTSEKEGFTKIQKCFDDLGIVYRVLMDNSILTVLSSLFT